MSSSSWSKFGTYDALLAAKTVEKNLIKKMILILIFQTLKKVNFIALRNVFHRNFKKTVAQDVTCSSKNICVVLC